MRPMTNRTHRNPTVVIRAARGSDGPALEQLAQLDSQARLAGDVLVAEQDGAVVAALAGDRAIADPFHPTADLVALLRMRAAPAARLPARPEPRRAPPARGLIPAGLPAAPRSPWRGAAAAGLLSLPALWSASRSGARTSTSARRSTCARSIPTACTRRSPPGSRRSWASDVRVRTATLEQPEHGLGAGGAGRDRRPDLVGPRGARPGRRTPSSTACTTRCSAAWACSCCTRATTRRSSSACSAPRAACAGATRASASWSGASPRRTRSRPASRSRSSSRRRRCTASPSTSRRPTSSCSSARSRAARCSAAAAASAAGAGRIFYFSPGDQEYPVYHHPGVQRVLANAVLWAAPPGGGHGTPPGSPQMPRGWFE